MRQLQTGTQKLVHCAQSEIKIGEQNVMTKTINYNDRGKTVKASNADVLLKKLRAAQDSFCHEGRWIDWLSESVPDAFEAYLQITSDLDEISEQLRKKHKKSPIEALSPKARAELTKTLGSVLELSALLKKRVADASRINWCLVDEFRCETEFVREAVESIKRSLERS
jgi:hypothetical protein